MTLSIACLLLSASLIKPISVADPVYPPNAVRGGTVVAAILIVSGEMKEVAILHGEQPLADAARAALQSWRFSPGIVRLRVPVIVSFRNPGLLTAAPATQRLSPPGLTNENRALAYPVQVVESSYPANALGQGSAVLQLGIDEEGLVSSVETVKSPGTLTEACSAAVRKWRFRPARDKQGRSIPSDAFAVCVYRVPVISAPAAK